MRTTKLTGALAVAGAMAVSAMLASAKAEDTIKIGVLHSLSGTMAISETTLKDTILMMVDDVNKKGGLLGKKVEAVVVDPASNWPLFAEKARDLIVQGQGRGGVRLLDLGVAQIGAAGIRGAERSALLSGAVRGRRELEQRVLHRRRAKPAGDPGGRISDGQGRRRGEALGARRHRLRLSAHHQQDPRSLSQVEGRRARGHQDQLHAVRPLRLADRGRGDQELRLGRQEDGGGLDDQRRRQRALLQGAGQCRHQGVGHPGRRLLGRRGGARRHRHQEPGRPSRRLELLRVGEEPDQRRLHQAVARLSSRTRSA